MGAVPVVGNSTNFNAYELDGVDDFIELPASVGNNIYGV